MIYVEHLGRRHYIHGVSLRSGRTLKVWGCKWDPFMRSWWHADGKQAAFLAEEEER